MANEQAMNNEGLAREQTPEPQVIPSQHRLQQIMEVGNAFLAENPDEIAYYQSQGLIFSNSDGELFLATPYKKKQN